MSIDSREFSSVDVESNDDASQMLFAKRRCCFCFPYLSSHDRSSSGAGNRWWNKIRAPESEEGLWSRGINSLKKLREWSEIVAGPKWKTFIRRFNRNKSGLPNSKSSKFQYDPMSYSLNFDEGPGQNGDSDQADDYLYRNFSSRYATVAAVPAKGLVDIGKDGKNLS